MKKLTDFFSKLEDAQGSPRKRKPPGKPLDRMTAGKGISRNRKRTQGTRIQENKRMAEAMKKFLVSKETEVDPEKEMEVKDDQKLDEDEPDTNASTGQRRNPEGTL